jgi:predicted nucleic acid-binding protein
MPQTAYFDSALWIAVLVGEPTAGDVGTLIGEIKKENGRILTSIMTLTEITVRAHRDSPARVADAVQLVTSVAAICNVSLEVALMTAQIEARFMTSVWADTEGSRRRRWDALHLPTAAAYKADVVYTFDRRLLHADFSAEPRIPAIRLPQPQQGSLPYSPT